MKYRAKHILEYAFVRQLVFFLRLMPYRMALFNGWLLAAIAFYLVRFRVDEAKRRVHEVFPGRFTNREGSSRVVWVSWRNFLFCVVDMIRLSSVSERWVRKNLVNYDDTEHRVKEVFSRDSGAVLVCPHTGSWELAGVMLQMLDVPIFFITGKQKNPLVDQYLNRLRSSTGIETVQRGSSLLKSVIRRLKKGGVLALLPDVRARQPEIQVDFLGTQANVPAGMALFARQANVPIITGISSRVGWTKHKMRSYDAILPDKSLDKKEDWARMTQMVFTNIEDFVRCEPEQWFWFNKRWILEPLSGEEGSEH